MWMQERFHQIQQNYMFTPSMCFRGLHRCPEGRVWTNVSGKVLFKYAAHLNWFSVLFTRINLLLKGERGFPVKKTYLFATKLIYFLEFLITDYNRL